MSRREDNTASRNGRYLGDVGVRCIGRRFNNANFHVTDIVIREILDGLQSEKKIGQSRISEE